MNRYPRLLTRNLELYDPLELALETGKLACKGNARKYTDFYATGVYGGIATGYTVGCCLRCYYCWVDWSRDYPERYGEFYSPEQAFLKLKGTARKFGVKKMRISGAEPTICKEHLLGLLEHVENSEFSLFVLETNGILFGTDKDYVGQVSTFTKPHIRVSLKAGNPEGFAERTGAVPEAFELPYRAIENLVNTNASFHVAAMTDARIMSREERAQIITRLEGIQPSLGRNLEEERIDRYDTTLVRLEKAGVKLD